MLGQVVHSSEEVVTSLCFMPHNGKNLLVSSSGDGTTALWDAVGVSAAGSQPQQQQMERVISLGHHRDAVNDVLPLPEAMHPSGCLCTASDDRTIAVWDLRQTATPVQTIRGCGDGINKMLLLPRGAGPEHLQDCHLIVSACDDGLVYIHSLSTDLTQVTLVDQFWVALHSVNDLLYHEGTLITASEDCAVRSWRLPFQPNMPVEQRIIESVDEFSNPINHICFVPDGLLPPPPPPPVDAEILVAADAAAGGPAAMAGEIDLSSPQQEYSPSSPQVDDAGASSAAVMQRGPATWMLAACSELAFGTDFYGANGTFGKAVKTFQGHSDYIRGMLFSKEGTLLTVSDDTTLLEWNLNSCEMIRQVKLHDSLIMSSAMTPDKEVLATGTAEGEIRLWKLPFQTECMCHE